MVFAIRRFLLAWMSVALVLGCQFAPRENSAKKVTILFTNDAHTHIDNQEGCGLRYSHVAWLKKASAAKNATFLVDAGDYLQGTSYGVFDGGEQIVNLMNAAGYDVATIGNHEFDFHATNLLARSQQAGFSVVSCNTWQRDLNRAEKIHAFASYTILTNKGVSVAFVGLTTPDTSDSENPKCFYLAESAQDWGFWGYPQAAANEFYDCVQQAVDEARKYAPDYVILLGHAGLSDELKPYRSLDVIAHTSGFAGFIDGHSHTECAQMMVTNKVGEIVTVAQTGSFLATVGRMTLARGQVPQSELVRCVNGKDENVARMEENLIKIRSNQLSEKLVNLNFDMPVKAANQSWLVRSHATAIGDLVADAFYWAMNKGETQQQADVAIIQGGGIRDGLKAGAITRKDALAINPFQNEILVVKMSGRLLLDALEWGAHEAPSFANSKLLHVAGLRYAIVTNQSPHIGRVRDVKIYDRTNGTWKPLVLTNDYRVASVDYLLRNGGSGFSMLTNAIPVQSHANRKLDADQFADYLKSFRDGVLTSKNSPLYEPGYMEVLSYENPLGGERIKFIAQP